MTILDQKLHAEILNSSAELKLMLQNQFYNLEQDIQSNISNLSEFMFETYSDLKFDIKTTNITLHDNLNQMFKESSDQNSMTQVIINGFNNQVSNNFSFLYGKLENISSVIHDNQLNITTLINDNQFNIKNNFTQMLQKIDNANIAVNDFKSISLFNFSAISTQINSLDTKISSSFSSVLNTCSKETTVEDLKTQINKLNDKINELSVNISIQTSGCKTVGAIPEGDGLCKCAARLGSGVIVPDDLYHGQWFTYRRSYFSISLNMCCSQYKNEQYTNNAFDYDDKYLCGNGLLYDYSYAGQYGFRPYTNFVLQ
ncbi:Hypothetical_protein [Hexamita inflata]|uniref:Hypothetical_protein n=1 Tax=Hexamita inflata TaxID=28002 RepID=A0AA86QJF6_9EUKA|nr:Hypothetical protein HINF_LOCUS47465 [Hexamita inflata]